MTVPAEQTMINGVAAPDTCHPAYAGRYPWLRDWLNEPDGRDHLVIMFPRPVRVWTEADADVTTVPEPPRHMLTRRKARGPAPYVGRPYVYQWRVAVDGLGRQVAGSVEIQWTAQS